MRQAVTHSGSDAGEIPNLSLPVNRSSPRSHSDMTPSREVMKIKAPCSEWPDSASNAWSIFIYIYFFKYIVVGLKFKHNWASYILSGNLNQIDTFVKHNIHLA